MGRGISQGEQNPLISFFTMKLVFFSLFLFFFLYLLTLGILQLAAIVMGFSCVLGISISGPQCVDSGI
jgi:hypothetical protein